MSHNLTSFFGNFIPAPFNILSVLKKLFETYEEITRLEMFYFWICVYELIGYFIPVCKFFLGPLLFDFKEEVVKNFNLTENEKENEREKLNIFYNVLYSVLEHHPFINTCYIILHNFHQFIFGLHRKIYKMYNFNMENFNEKNFDDTDCNTDIDSRNSDSSDKNINIDNKNGEIIIKNSSNIASNKILVIVAVFSIINLICRVKRKKKNK